MIVIVNLDYSQLCVLNSFMVQLDTIVFEGLKKNLKSVVSICLDLREKLLQKAIKMRASSKVFKLKLKFYMAEALLNYLIEFDIFFDSPPGSYEANALTMIRNQLHQNLQ